MKLIVGLGNPGDKYHHTRHNIGFLTLDKLAQKLGITSWKSQLRGELAQCTFKTQKVLLLKPQTFMNLSGECVIPVMQFYKVNIDDLLVLQDDVDLPLGELRFQRNRGHGGQNGIRNISEQLGHTDYSRLKLGVGRPTHPEHQLADYVLSPFSSEEAPLLDKTQQRAINGIETWILDGLAKASDITNRKS
jgi:PTH1 family peptidyl-tRNA hydrolase